MLQVKEAGTIARTDTDAIVAYNNNQDQHMHASRGGIAQVRNKGEFLYPLMRFSAVLGNF